MIRPRKEGTRRDRERLRSEWGGRGGGGGVEVGGVQRQTKKPEREEWDEEPDSGVDREMEQLKRGRQLGPARTEQLLRPISSSTRPRHSLA